MIKKSAIIVNSPFQALCAIEAISHYGEVNPDFFVFDCGDSKNKIINLLELYGYRATILPFSGTSSLILEVIKKGTYSRIYLGDYYSYDQYLVGVMMANWFSNIFYLDDGNSTLSLLPGVNRKRYSFCLCKRYVFFLLLDLIAVLKCVKKTYFTLYDISGYTKIKVEKNTLSLFSSSKALERKSGVYIIGTNSSLLSFKDKTYSEMLRKTYQYIRNHCNTNLIYYCPHRRDTYNYDELLYEMGIHTFATEISVEVDFITKHVNPEYIIGFGSTALLTLKYIFPLSEVSSVHLQLSDPQLNDTYQSIEGYYRSNNIDIIDF